ncbi:MAG: class I SAM-dependent methyltransferase [Ignavibacteriaceae bacterium]|nr:class I SAM-dependent methyltransferase [Ignavibacteriaceae bacterium]
MSDFASNFWDERYSSVEYVYGTEPNHFFKEQIYKIPLRGKILLPGEGEGRNAVYAAKLGWQVYAFDQSKIAQQKALRLAEKNEVKINYHVTNLNEFSPANEQYDVVAVIYVHLKEDFRQEFNKKLIDSLKTGGLIIIELFSKEQFGKNSGGPQDLTMLYSLDEIKKNFRNLKASILKEENIHLDESDKHKGEASVIRFVGEKIK